MRRTQVQFPDPLYHRIKEVAELNDWALADVVRRAVELYVQRFPVPKETTTSWTFPSLDLGGDFLIDPKDVHSEVEALNERGR